MAVITISRQFGSGGDDIAAEICKITTYRLFDKEVLARAASEAGLSDQEMIDYCEDDYKVKNFMERLFGGARQVAQVRVWKEDRAGVLTFEELNLNETQALSCVQKAVETAFALGNMVIVGRGGQIILKDRPGVLHVRVIAALEDRLLRVRQSGLLAGRDFSDSVDERRAAQNLIEKNDQASADYLKRFYNVDWNDPNCYHLLVNASKLEVGHAARTIVAAAEALAVTI